MNKYFFLILFRKMVIYDIINKCIELMFLGDEILNIGYF